MRCEHGSVQLIQKAGENCGFRKGSLYRRVDAAEGDATGLG